MNETKKSLGLAEVNEILSNALLQVTTGKISPKRAQVISRIALALSKNITHIELKQRIDVLEQMLIERKRK
ncbi:MAG: hypothetical protein KBC62_01400 [Candidatus Pacebacteria bacterium]|nr:hypothetical protein [Candidatus Paceibacterota bacterium]